MQLSDKSGLFGKSKQIVDELGGFYPLITRQIGRLDRLEEGSHEENEYLHLEFQIIVLDKGHLFRHLGQHRNMERRTKFALDPFFLQNLQFFFHVDN